MRGAGATDAIAVIKVQQKLSTRASRRLKGATPGSDGARSHETFDR